MKGLTVVMGEKVVADNRPLAERKSEAELAIAIWQLTLDGIYREEEHLQRLHSFAKVAK